MRATSRWNYSRLEQLFPFRPSALLRPWAFVLTAGSGGRRALTEGLGVAVGKLKLNAISCWIDEE